MRVTVGADARPPSGLNLLHQSLDAPTRRGWLEKDDVLNTLGLNDLQARSQKQDS